MTLDQRRKRDYRGRGRTKTKPRGGLIRPTRQQIEWMGPILKQEHNMFIRGKKQMPRSSPQMHEDLSFKCPQEALESHMWSGSWTVGPSLHFQY